jgi:hypothetical protein
MRLSGVVTSTHRQLGRAFVSIQRGCSSFSHPVEEAGKRFVIFALAFLDALVSPRLATTCHRVTDLFSQRAQF